MTYGQTIVPEESLDCLKLYSWGIDFEELQKEVCDGQFEDFLRRSLLQEPAEIYRRKKKKPRRRDDLLWKGALEELHEDFLRFFFPDQIKNLDLERGITFLDKELAQLFPPDKDEYAPRHVDKLARVFTREGKEEYILIHTEVQGYRDTTFAERMFQYYYRVWDKFRKPITALAILTEGNKKFHPTTFTQECLGTSLRYSFNTYKLKEQDTALLEKSDNPFAIVLLAAGAVLNARKNNEEQLYEQKIHLLKRLLALNIPKKKIDALLVFLERIIRFRDKEMDTKFNETKDQLIENKKTMGIIEAAMEATRLEALDEGMEKGIKKGKEQFVKYLILQLGFDDEQAATTAEVSEAFVRKIRRKMKQ